MRAFAVDDASTWPLGVGDLLREAHPRLPNGPDGHPHFAARDALVAEVDRRLAGWSVLAWHCTRLCPDEVAAIRAEGMRLSSRAWMVERVRRRVGAGDLTPAEADRILGARRAHDDARCGQIWFSVTRHAAAGWGKSGMWHLWGGEALYAGELENDDALTLGRLGAACVVELAVPVDWIGSGAVAWSLFRAFEWSRGLERVELVAGLSFVGLPLGPDRVLRVLIDGDHGFAALILAANSLRRVPLSRFPAAVGRVARQVRQQGCKAEAHSTEMPQLPQAT